MKNWICLFIIMLTLGLVTSYSFGEEEKQTFKIIISDNTLEKKDYRLDINTASEEEMTAQKISKGYISKITDYREKTGGFEKLEELKRIKGIGEATFQKLSKKFKVEAEFERKPIYINEADDELLKYFGFTKKEIKAIRTRIDKKGKIYNNIELMELLSKKRYEEYKNLVKYEKF